MKTTLKILVHDRGEPRAHDGPAVVLELGAVAALAGKVVGEPRAPHDRQQREDGEARARQHDGRVRGAAERARQQREQRRAGGLAAEHDRADAVEEAKVHAVDGRRGSTRSGPSTSSCP